MKIIKHKSTSIRRLMLLLVALLWLCCISAFAQNRQKVVVLNFDSKVPNYLPSELGNLVRLELDKLDTFEVMDRYDVKYLVDKKQLKVDECYGKICLVDIGKSLGADKMLTGSLEVFGDAMIYTMHFIDVKEERVELTQVTEFLNQPAEVQTMTAVMLRELFKRPIDPNVITQLVKPDSYDARARMPVTEKMRLDGPRMGAAYFTGETARILSSAKAQGGYGAFPLMFQFGYQFEQQYLSAGQYQALFEFIPMITGLDQGIFIPSFTIMNGLRANRRGWEFGFGPSFNLVTRTRGYYDASHNWITREQWTSDTALNTGTPPAFIERMDSRGDVQLGSSFVFAFGKTFRSGTMNIPVNAFISPGTSGWRFGISFGYNARKPKSVTTYK